jgi:ornithine carbamoyltransferase
MAAPLFSPNLAFISPPKIAAGKITRDVDLAEDELLAALDLTAQVKNYPRRFSHVLAGQFLTLLFEKQSLRTRATFEIAIKQLGGEAVTSIGPIGEREPVKDVARNFERWTQAIVARTFLQSTVDELARWSRVPVINGLSDQYHPCQALADVFTLQEHFGNVRGLKLAFVGDGNNVAHSLMLCAARLGMHFSLACPKGYEPNPEIVAEACAFADANGVGVEIMTDPVEAVAGAHAVYTDVWTSMGQEQQRQQRLTDFADYQVNAALFGNARVDACFMHCLPAHRGEEVSDEVIESPRSVVFDQAENRLHVQKALLLMLLS